MTMKYLISLTTLLLLPVLGQAGDLALDAFYQARSRHVDTATLGVGIGVQYLFTPNFGLAAAGIAEDASTDWSAEGSLLLRYPLRGWAVYLKPGVGHDWTHVDYKWPGHDGLTFHCLGGAEYDFTEKIAGFTEAGYRRTMHGQGDAIGRVGVRFKF